MDSLKSRRMRLAVFLAPVLVFVVAASIRLGFSAKADYLLPEVIHAPVISPDSYDYDARALNILHGRRYDHGYSEADALYRTPGYPFFLSLLYRIFGHSFVAVRYVQAMVGAATCVLVYMLALTAFGSVGIALLSGIIAALYPLFLFDCIQILTECLFTFLFTAAVLLILLFKRSGKVVCLLAGGAMAALSTLTRPVGVFVLPFAALWFLIVMKEKTRSVAYGLILVATGCLCIAPWSLRNYFVTGRPVLLSSQGPAVFWTGTGRLNTTQPTKGDEALKKQSIPSFLKTAARNVARDPRRFARQRLRYFFRFWRIVPGFQPSWLRNVINILSISGMPILGLFGLVAAFRRHRGVAIFFVVLAAGFSVIHTLSVGAVRYRVPLLDPLLIVLASHALILFVSHHAGRCACRTDTRNGE